jgi:hypothetical protein
MRTAVERCANAFHLIEIEDRNNSQGAKPVMNPERIQTEHDRLGYGLGWRFMTAPASNRLTSEIAMVGLNPGGTQN